MVYDTFTVDGINIPHIRSYKIDKNNRTITLNCSALIENTTPLDVRTEIKQFEDIACDTINNTQLMNGGSCLEVCNCDPILVSDGVNAWVGALLQPVIDENKRSHKRIDYDLIILYETIGSGITFTSTGGYYDDEGELVPGTDETETPDSDDVASKRYINTFCGISNIQFWPYTDLVTTSDCCWVIGKMVITETRNVKQVIIQGAAQFTPAWIEVNGQRQNWTKCYDCSAKDFYTNVPENQIFGSEFLTFNLSSPGKILTIQTSPRLPSNFDANNCRGAIIMSIEVVFE